MLFDTVRTLLLQAKDQFSHVSGTLEHTVVNSSYADYADFTSDISSRRYVDPFQGRTVPPTSIYNFYITVSSTL